MTRRGCIAAFCLVGMAWFLGGCRFVPAGMVSDQWDFRNGDSRPWTSPNADAVASPEGIMLSPRGDPAILVGSSLALDLRGYRALHVSLMTPTPSEGRLGLVIRDDRGDQHSVVPFQTRGQTLETVDVDLTSLPAGVLMEMVVVPSLVRQAVVVRSIRFSPTGFREVTSAQPGIDLAIHVGSFNAVAPPSLKGRSVWQWLLPVVVGLAIAVVGIEGRAAWHVPARLHAIKALLAIWSLGVCFLVYHQGIALRVDVARFLGVTQDEKYQRLDDGPVSLDMRTVASFVDSGDSIEFVIDADAVKGGFLRGRAAYYLAPVPVLSEGATFRLYYFTMARPPCSAVEPSLALVRESSRFCLFRSRAS